MSPDGLVETIVTTLEKMQDTMLESALQFLEDNTITSILTYEDMRAHFKDNHGFVVAKWAGSAKDEGKLKELNVTIRCFPYNQSGTNGKCIITGKPTTVDAIFAKAY